MKRKPIPPLRLILSLAIILVIPITALAAGEFQSLAAGIIAMYSRPVTPAPTPGPTPKPSTVCDNCNGTGKLGDGTVFVKCPVCDGTGKKVQAPAPAQPAEVRAQAAAQGHWEQRCNGSSCTMVWVPHQPAKQTNNYQPRRGLFRRW
jgi:hypothetical protein